MHEKQVNIRNLEIKNIKVEFADGLFCFVITYNRLHTHSE